MSKIVIDADGIALGRVGSLAAKESLKGNEVAIVNCDKARISGSKKDIMQKSLRFRRMGGSGLKGPRFVAVPDRYFKRKIRGMFPWQAPRGRKLWKDLRCYSGVPKELEKEKLVGLERKKMLNYMSVKEICSLLRGGRR
jgi:large subunit ribosomal protein L13